MHLRALSFAVGLVLVACSGDEGESATESSTGTDTADTGTTSPTDPTEGALDPACSCLETDSCGPEICKSVGLDCEETCPADQPVDDEAALQCALEALRDRKPGRIGWYTRENFGQYAYGTDVYIQPEGDAVVTRGGGADLCSYSGPDARHSLEAPDYFAECLTLASGRERFDCMTDGLLAQLVECAPEQQSCES